MGLLMNLKSKINFLPESITRDQEKDTGMAIVLILLLAGLSTHRPVFPIAAVIILLLDMTIPQIFHPAAIIWFGLSHFMGTVMSKVILCTVFFLLVTPIGLARRIAGSDPMQLKEWKKGRRSVFKTRNHKFKPEDLRVPY